MKNETWIAVGNVADIVMCVGVILLMLRAVWGLITLLAPPGWEMGFLAFVGWLVIGWSCAEAIDRLVYRSK